MQTHWNTGFVLGILPYAVEVPGYSLQLIVASVANSEVSKGRKREKTDVK